MQTTARPRFRTDLVAEPVEEGGHRYIDIVDPDTGNGFRFYDVEYSLACAMDGERDLVVHSRAAREALDAWAEDWIARPVAFGQEIRHASRIPPAQIPPANGEQRSAGIS